MARKPNYSFEKNLRAKAKADKKEAKRLAKLAAKQGAADDNDGLDTDAEPDAESPVAADQTAAEPNT